MLRAQIKAMSVYREIERNTIQLANIDKGSETFLVIGARITRLLGNWRCNPNLRGRWFENVILNGFVGIVGVGWGCQVQHIVDKLNVV